MRWRLEIEALTPVVISGGETLTAVDYALVGDSLLCVDTPGALAEARMELAGFAQAASRPGFVLEGLGSALVERHARYRLRLDPGVRSRLAALRPSVVSFIRSAGRAYLSGSSVKGALRTALLASLLAGDAGLRARAEQAGQEALRRPDPPRQAAERIERALFGPEPRFDWMRAVSVLDSAPVEPDQMTVVDVRIANEGQDGRLRWFVRPGVATDSPDRAAVLFAEALRPGARLALEIRLREDLLTGPPAAGLRFPAAHRQVLGRLAAAIREGSQRVLEREEAHYRRWGLVGVAQAVGRLRERNTEQTPLLALGWGTGWRAKSVAEAFGPSFVEALRRAYRLGRAGLPFPKSRRLVFEGGQPAWPLGWVALRGWEAA